MEEKNKMWTNEKLLYLYLRHGDYPTEHTHNGYWEFIYILSGSYIHRINGKERIVGSKTLLFLRPNDRHCTIKRTNDSSYLTFCVDEQYLNNYLYLIDSSLSMELSRCEFIEINVSDAKNESINAIVNQLFCASDEPENAVCSTLFLEFLSEAIACPLVNMTPGTYSTAVISFMRLLNDPANLRKKLSELIALTGYSYSHFNSIFRSETGETPSQYLKKKQLTYAKKLLTTSDMKHEQIAYAIGFATYARFCVFFKACTGLTPTQYSRQYQVKWSTS